MRNRDEKKASIQRADLAREATRLTGRSIDSLAAPLLELSARRPYVEGRGGIYVVHPSVWDGRSDAIGMLPTMVDPEGSGTISMASSCVRFKARLPMWTLCTKKRRA